MDIKDFILVGGGVLIAAVVAHGFWVAWRARREPLRLDIVPNLFPEDVDEMERLRGELPNGGARVIQSVTSGEQASLDLDSAPLLLEPSEHEFARSSPAEPPVDIPRVSLNESATAAGRDLSSEGRISEIADVDEPLAARVTQDVIPHEDASRQRAKVAGVAIPEAGEPFAPAVRQRTPMSEFRASSPGEATLTVAEPTVSSAKRSDVLDQGPRRPLRLSVKPESEIVGPTESQQVQELLALNVLASDGQGFTGAELFSVLHGHGLKFGNMNIFHRVDPRTKIVQYSVANVVEPGTFDVADLDAFHSPGLCFFLQLPGPEHPADVLEDMFEVAGVVCADLHGELKDDQHNFLSGQMVEHYRQRIMDYSRRRMSKQA